MVEVEREVEVEEEKKRKTMIVWLWLLWLQPIANNANAYISGVLCVFECVFECVCVRSHCIVYSFISTRSCLRMSAFEQERTHLVQRITNVSTSPPHPPSLPSRNSHGWCIIGVGRVWRDCRRNQRQSGGAQQDGRVCGCHGKRVEPVPGLSPCSLCCPGSRNGSLRMTPPPVSTTCPPPVYNCATYTLRPTSNNQNIS